MNTKRKKYEKPSMKSETIMETSALVCGKCSVGPTAQFACGSLPLNS